MSQTTLDLIESYLTALHWRFDRDADTSHIVTGFAGSHHSFLLVINVWEDKHALGIMAPGVLHLEQRRRLEVLQTLLMLNYGLPLGGFGVDLSDGEVAFEANIPIDDVAISVAQFQQTIGIVCSVVDIGYQLLNRVLWTEDAPLDAINATMHEQLSTTAQTPTDDVEV